MAVKADLIKFTKDELGITYEEATNYIEKEINFIKTIMKNGDKLVISNFGTFKTVKKGTLKHYNIVTQSVKNSPSHSIPQISFAKSFKKEIRKL
ncbi:HU family DNA-binding protein [Pediococcus pentosaceus]|uniref:HU family DNA-binding protein n=1 Tax=Pediococcus pentosaceus TaxID=1255 RepID=UPI002018063D|nr:HU family DNA-binding protein [Pediococcus pentosaceus]MCL3859329.1 HU family DNA-binding protein [Pediococcus pentosaceus]MDE3750587.1 HU family DNA-binding protein [Pediococcus pentosaceus]